MTEGFGSLQGLMLSWIRLCALTAALELLASDKSRALGFRAVCGLAMALCAARAIHLTLG